MGPIAAVTAVLLLWGAALAPAREGSRFREAVRGPLGVVASESPAASQIGLDVLNGGGNAIDAAVAMVFGVSVARPQSCGIGGGGFLVYRGATGETAALDFRESAPAAYRPNSLAGPGLNDAFTGHLTVGVPGTVAGMAAALERYGTLPLARAVAPAERLARDGFPVPQSLSAQMAASAPRLRLYPAAAEQFLVGGTAPYPPGSTLRQPVLAETLRLIADQGPDAFYRGRIAELIEAEMRAPGKPATDPGLITRDDLAGYRAIWREPLRGTYRGREVIAMPPPTSGGIAAIEMLNLLEGFDLRAAGQSSADALHLIAESEKIAFADRGAYVADPDQVSVPVATLTSKAYADRRRGEIERERAKSYPPGDVSGERRRAGEDMNPRASTTHVSVIDAAGNAVALTCTVEFTFGSAVVAPGTGFILNNELTDFSGPGTANEPNAGKRPRSSMSPTILVQDGRPVLAVGGAGGATIIMGSLLATVQMVDFGQDVARAVDAERLDEMANPTMSLEETRVPPAAQAELERRGHRITPQGEYGTVPRVQAAGIDLATGERLATSDPRTDFAALAQQPAPGAAARPPEGRPAGTRGRFLISRRALRVTRAGKVRLRVSCRRAGATCRGRIVLRQAAGRRSRLGARGFTVAAGRRATLAVPLTPSGRRAVRAARRLRVRARFVPAVEPGAPAARSASFRLVARRR